MCATTAWMRAGWCIPHALASTSKGSQKEVSSSGLQAPPDIGLDGTAFDRRLVQISAGPARLCQGACNRMLSPVQIAPDV
ncbi:hypothetical protein B0T11DRAFT_282827 [Plectosphaerella cucumerina]|uniref:Uncharacterized protein n=1 Tax=Plectosphaerella cucumerina TaxID=40658 RepID=A0A8K0TNH0_9PEZI|nr:hypothetical protein B0T11DRAFT_282827 [Plectosphaerella cucumerina]